MPPVHPRPWHRGSVFGDGPRRPLDREQRARFRYLLTAHRRARRLTPTAELVGDAMLRRLGVDGRLDPSHDRIAEDVGCSSRTVRRVLVALKAVGLLVWQRRIFRTGPCVDQVSNAYALLTPHGNPTGGQVGRETRPLCNKGLTYLLPISDRDREVAREALALRRRAIEARLLGKG